MIPRACSKRLALSQTSKHGGIQKVAAGAITICGQVAQTISSLQAMTTQQATISTHRWNRYVTFQTRTYKQTQTSKPFLTVRFLSMTNKLYAGV